ncbi:putative metal-dependent HD superfamily phosphohydrolase [Chryseobacterium sp. SORGH_AS 447]|uniref:hypothetical protein n=1 Tax=Chryseobacterium sp. SORGH_AS_0447 TaxID=3041769 RepID=UPI0027829508|nr:hypothetical protein [Chryseobacterium sp. SORGH_AS_0447]MDQ1163002.1 putative metal-dependent HD superfamily phosphohydrolase [Chryseobacterium sp. SORGH_AS_0447]
MNLRERFTKGCLQFADDHRLIEDLWAELEKKYTEKGRHYHNLAHLENMFAELDTVKDKIADFSTVSFSVFTTMLFMTLLRKRTRKRVRKWPF